jgi:hypothetical protein
VRGRDAIPYESTVSVEADRPQFVDVTLHPAAHGPLVPAWAWIAGGTVLASVGVVSGYFAFRSSDSQAASPVLGSIDTVHLH